MGARGSHEEAPVSRKESSGAAKVEDRFCLTERDRAGCLFVISTPSKPKPAGSSTQSDDYHYSVVVDVSGESDDSWLVGKELSVQVDAASKVCYVFRHDKGRWTLASLATWKHLGRLPLPPDLFADEESFNSAHPDLWGTKLDMMASELYTQMVKELGRKSWPHEPSFMFAERVAAQLLRDELVAAPSSEDG
ncbi:uncharacterized protein ACA1_077010 [Acanthamoeba castellanii str. Neff]|uniref:Uncharacterized protein n=1 Tax=Acanthamoeba castellanii (strain ATCC 30010 / Neff) TaxID=1257118 RepID=L8GM68_ACACF|nr:uncharacterized protein ACA1_077010 [Acanthamoeba castellanii str. Neff]ELR13848.1 hypothetical protein ACA1_077010 [Acanthamoeba castellanii str. Neff]